jgi:hypothetical protein
MVCNKKRNFYAKIPSSGPERVLVAFSEKKTPQMQKIHNLPIAYGAIL